MNFIFSIQLGISSSQLTNSYFSEGFKPPTRWEYHGNTSMDLFIVGKSHSRKDPPSTAIFYPEHGWEIAEVNGGLFIAMFDCWRVSNINWLFMLPHPTTKLQI